MVEGPTYVDVNVFIYWLGRHPIQGEKALSWIKKIEAATARQYVTSTLTVYETLVILAGLTGRTLKDAKFVSQVVNAFTVLKGLSLEPLKKHDLLDALNMMKKYSIDYEDALHLAVATRTRAKNIVSNDKDWDKTPIKRIF